MGCARAGKHLPSSGAAIWGRTTPMLCSRALRAPTTANTRSSPALQNPSRSAKTRLRAASTRPTRGLGAPPASKRAKPARSWSFCNISFLCPKNDKNWWRARMDGPHPARRARGPAAGKRPVLLALTHARGNRQGRTPRGCTRRNCGRRGAFHTEMRVIFVARIEVLTEPILGPILEL